MRFGELDRGELLSVFGGILLGVSLILNWYALGNHFASINACHGPHTNCKGWDALLILRWIFLLAAVAPAILAWIVVRGHALSWPRGELTAVVALVALVFTFFRGVIDKPGSPPGQITVDYGWWVALIGGFLILIGSAWRSQESAARRKPPGVL